MVASGLGIAPVPEHAAEQAAQADSAPIRLVALPRAAVHRPRCALAADATPLVAGLPRHRVAGHRSYTAVAVRPPMSDCSELVSINARLIPPAVPNAANGQIPSGSHKRSFSGHLLGYARVSTADQDVPLQHDALRRAVRAGLDRRRVRRAGGASELARLSVRLLQGDTLVVWRLDRRGGAGATAAASPYC